MTSTATPMRVAKPRAHFATDNKYTQTFTGHPIEMQADGSAIVKDVPVFKAGTFRDSWGDQHTWTAEHLQQMVDNFDLLRLRDIFPDVPVRQDHSSSIDRVMGYFHALRTDGSLLIADLHVTEPTSLDKLARGTYRSRSLEVGMFVANDESAYWPVVFGVAYVDIPAVEGLHSKPNAQISYFSYAAEENPMSGAAGTAPANATTPVPGVTINLNQPNDLAPAKPAVSEHAAPAAPAPVAPAPAPGATFRINGVETTDFAKAQAHIDTLEAFAKGTVEAGRKNFVSKLAAENKITATQKPDLEAFALGLSDDQYAAWCKTFDGAPAAALLSQHGNATTGGAPAGEIDPKEDRKSVLNETIKMHERAGMKPEQIKKTSAYQELQTLNATS